MRIKHLVLLILILGLAMGMLFAQILADQDAMVKGQRLPAPFAPYNPQRSGSLVSSTLLFGEDFDPAPVNWTLVNGWNIGVDPVFAAISGSNSAFTQNPYAHGALYQLLSPSISLPALNSPGTRYELKLWHWWELESNYDFVYIDVLVAGQIQSTIFSQTGYQNWIQNSLDLSSYAGQSIQLQFRLSSDASGSYAGFGIDDLEIWQNVYAYVPELNLLSLNAQNFPFIYSTLAVEMEGQELNNLDASNFQVYENGVLQSNFFSVTPPSTGTGSRLVDIAFQMDNSGSMSSSIAAISANVTSFINNLADSGVDSALGLCRYGQDAYSGAPILEDNGVLSTNLSYFRDQVWARNVVNGYREPGYEALNSSLAGFNWRPGSQKVLIIITDETPNQSSVTLQDAIDACTANGAILFALTYSALYSTFTPITDATGGAVYDINSNFDDILNQISQVIVSNYIISYRSSNPYYDGTLRNLRYVMNYNNLSAEETGSYFPGQAPQIARSEDTIALDLQAQLDNQPLEIQAIISDTYAPFTNSATLYYKNFGQNAYKAIAMQNIAGNLWSAQIPALDVQTPGVAYYFLATDGQSTSTLPSSEPANNPFTVAVLPNLPPLLEHFPLLQTNFHTPLNISVSIWDDTDYIDQVILAYRKYGQLSYTQIPMVGLGNNLYSLQIPGEVVGSTGVEYYIRAWDNYGLVGASGYADAPHYVSAMLDGTVIPGGEITDFWWPAQNSPYYISANIYVPADHSLQIESGSTLIFAPASGLEIQGALQASGVQFSAQNPLMGWSGILFSHTIEPSLIQNCAISYAVAGLTFWDANAEIQDCVISKDMENNSFSDEVGVSIQGASSPQINGLELWYYANGIVIDNAGDHSSCHPIIENVALHQSGGILRNASIGMKVQGEANLTIQNLSMDEYSNGILWMGSSTNGTRSTVLLSNIRVRNSTSTSRIASRGIYMVNISALEGEDIEVAGYAQGWEIDNVGLANAGNALLSNIRVRNSSSTSRQTEFGIKISAQVALTLEDAVIEGYSQGLLISSDAAMPERSTVLLSNIRVRNSSSTSRVGNQGIYIINMSALQAEDILVDGYAIGIEIDNQNMSNAANALLSNIRVRNSSSSSRTEDVGLRILGRVAAVVQDMQAREYATGIYYEGDGQPFWRTTPLLSNIRVRNSSSSSRDGAQGIVLKNLAAIDLKKCSIYPVLSEDSTQNSNGAGIVADGVASLNVLQSSIWGYENGMRLRNASHANFTRSVIWKNTVAELAVPILIDNSTVNASYSDISIPGGVYPGQGNIDMNPKFIDPSNGIFYLKPRSVLHNDDPNLVIGALPYDFYVLAEEHSKTFAPGWNMFGVPYLTEAGHSSPTAVFGSQLPPFYVSPYYTSILQLNPNAMPDSLGHVVFSLAPSYSVPSQIRAGVGYWVRNPNPSPSNVTVYGLMDDDPYLMEIPGVPANNDGFFMLANPYNRALKLNDGIRLVGAISPWVQIYNHEYSSLPPQDLNMGIEIPPWASFIVKANAAGDQILFEYPSSRSVQEIQAVAANAGLSTKPYKNPAWELYLNAYCEDQNATVVLGVAEGAADTYDPMDVPALPFSPLREISLKVNNQDWEEAAGNYSRDIRPNVGSSFSWQLSLDVEDLLIDGRYRGELRLNMNSPYKLPSGCSYRIIDLRSGISADLLGAGLTLALEIDSNDPRQGANPHLIPLQVVVEDANPSQADGIKQLSSSNFPNPFNPSTTISYTLPHRSFVNVEIFNIKGQLVRQVLSAMQNQGSHSVVWNGKDSRGRECSSGFYFYRINAGADSHQRKILMLK